MKSIYTKAGEAEIKNKIFAYMQNPSKDFAIDLKGNQYKNLGISESGKAIKIELYCSIQRIGDCDINKILNFWVPVSIIKDNIIPKWFVNKMLNEIINKGIIVTGIITIN